MSALTKEEAIAAVRAQAFEEEGEGSTCGHPGCTEHRSTGRRLIHCMVGGFMGADWEESSVIGAIEAAERLEWRSGLGGHDLLVVVRGRQLFFQASRVSA